MRLVGDRVYTEGEIDWQMAMLLCFDADKRVVNGVHVEIERQMEGIRSKTVLGMETFYEIRRHAQKIIETALAGREGTRYRGLPVASIMLA